MHKSVSYISSLRNLLSRLPVIRVVNNGLDFILFYFIFYINNLLHGSWWKTVVATFVTTYKGSILTSIKEMKNENEKKRKKKENEIQKKSN